MRYISFVYYKLIILCNTSVNSNDNDNNDDGNDSNNNSAFSQLQILNELSQSISSKQTNSMLSMLINGLKGNFIIIIIIYYYYYQYYYII